MKKFSVLQLAQMQGHLNLYRSVSETALEYGVSRQTIYNYFVFDKVKCIWLIKSDYVKKIEYIHLLSMQLRCRIEYKQQHLVDDEFLKDIMIFEKAVRELREMTPD